MKKANKRKTAKKTGRRTKPVSVNSKTSTRRNITGKKIKSSNQGKKKIDDLKSYKKKKIKDNRMIVNKRLRLLLAVFILIICILCIRVGYIQFVKGEEYRKKAFLQQTQTTVISPDRGLIYDRNGKELAVNISVETITMNPNEIRSSSQDIKTLSDITSEMLDIDSEKLHVKMQRESYYEIVAAKVDKEVAAKFTKYIDDNDLLGFYINEDKKRYYPEKNVTSHIIGFTGTDNQGLEGLERYLEEYLKGIPGKMLTDKDREGRDLFLENYKRIDEENGLNAVLTIDSNIQKMISDSLDRAIVKNSVVDGASAIVMDPWTGEVLAMVSKPDFDSNSPWEKPDGYKGTWTGHTQSDVNYLYRNNWKNKNIQDTYEPGSTFKAITSAAGLEENVITPDTIVNDDPLEIEDRTFNCWTKYLHGEETFTEAVYNSCNPVFIDIAMKMGRKKFYYYMDAFGFMDKTGIDLIGETNSIVHKNPSVVDMASASFGQRFTITPIQLITAYNAIINGGSLLKPLMVNSLIDDDGNIIADNPPKTVRKVISKETSDILRNILEGVVSEGTGKNAYVRGYRVAGKTGTSETTVDDTYVASFMAFAPADKPVISLLVVLRNPTGEYHSGGSVAAPVAAELVEEILEYLNIEREYTKQDEELIAKEVFTPQLMETDIETAALRTGSRNLGMIIIGDDETEKKIVHQNPAYNTSIPQNSFVVVYTEEDRKYVKMIDLEYKTVEESIKLMHELGLNIKITGMGRSINQSFRPGEEVELGTVVNVEFRYSKNIE